MIEGVEFCFCFGGMTNSAKLVGLTKSKSEDRASWGWDPGLDGTHAPDHFSKLAGLWEL